MMTKAATEGRAKAITRNHAKVPYPGKRLFERRDHSRSTAPLVHLWGVCQGVYLRQQCQYRRDDANYNKRDGRCEQAMLNADGTALI